MLRREILKLEALEQAPIETQLVPLAQKEVIKEDNIYKITEKSLPNRSGFFLSINAIIHSVCPLSSQNINYQSKTTLPSI